MVQAAQRISRAVALKLVDLVEPYTAGYVVGLIVWEVLEGLAITAVTAGAGAAIAMAKTPKALAKLLKTTRDCQKSSGG